MKGKFRKVASTLPGRKPGLARGVPLGSPIYPKFNNSITHIERRYYHENENGKSKKKQSDHHPNE